MYKEDTSENQTYSRVENHLHNVHVLLAFGTNDTTVTSHMNYDAITVGHTLLQKVIPSKLVQLFFRNNKGTMLS